MEDDVDRQGEMRKLIRLAVVRILIHTRYELIPGAKEKSTMDKHRLYLIHTRYELI